MGTNFWWIYDVVLIIIAVVNIYSCAKRGFSKIIILIVGCVAAVLLSSFISQSSSEYIYDKFVKKTSMEAVEEILEKYSPASTVKEAIEEQDYNVVVDEGRLTKLLQSDDAIEMLYEYTNQAAGDVVDTHDNFKSTLVNSYAELFAEQLGISLPPYVVREVTDKFSKDSSMFVETTKMILKTPDKAPEYIEENYIHQPAVNLIKAFVFIISYFIIMLLIRVVIYKTIELGLLNGYDRLDHVVGGIFGVIQAAAVIIMMAVLVKILIHIAESKGSFISYETVKETKLFRYIFDYIGKY